MHTPPFRSPAGQPHGGKRGDGACQRGRGGPQQRCRVVPSRAPQAHSCSDQREPHHCEAMREYSETLECIRNGCSFWVMNVLCSIICSPALHPQGQVAQHRNSMLQQAAACAALTRTHQVGWVVVHPGWHGQSGQEHDPCRGRGTGPAGWAQLLHLHCLGTTACRVRLEQQARRRRHFPANSGHSEPMQPRPPVKKTLSSDHSGLLES